MRCLIPQVILTANDVNWLERRRRRKLNGFVHRSYLTIVMHLRRKTLRMLGGCDESVGPSISDQKHDS